MLKKRSFFAGSLLLALMTAVFLYIITMCKSYTFYIEEFESLKFSHIGITYSDDSIVSNEEPVKENGCFKIVFNPLRQGSTIAEIKYYFEGDEDSQEQSYIGQSLNLNVGIFNVITDTTYSNIPNFSGYPIIYIAGALFFSVMAVYMIILFRKSLKSDMYSYGTVFNCSLMICFVGLAVTFIVISIYVLMNYYFYQAYSIHQLTVNIMFFVILVSVPLVLLYSVSMTISNISLIRHEGFRIVNALGIAISTVMTLGVALCVSMPFFMGTENHLFVVTYSIIASLYVFFELFLLGTKICALIAAKHIPEFNKDYIIILGCGIKKDGTLLPLLKGRADKAIEFYYKQLEATDKKAVFVPSGGQGSDEIISEGEAIKRYLLEQGIPREQIMPETKSTNTFENMKFSKELIGNDEAKVAFSTTNYHVFRSGIFSNQAGLNAEGMGSKTKWYFWPNAFIREFVGLLVSQKKKIIFLAVITALISVASSLLTV